jgi:hypothetical protein
MATDLKVDIRPRSLGELLDDAIRLSLADAPMLLALSGLFLIPASIALLFLLTLPASESPWLPLVLALFTALLLPLTGLGSGACQELFQRRANDKAVSLVACLGAALRAGLAHATGRAVTLVGVVLGLAFLVVPGLSAWLVTTAVHPLLVGEQPQLWKALAESGREAQRNPAKSVVVGLARLGALLFMVVNLHILIEVGLWIAGNLAGFDTALLNVALGLSNPAYVAALVLFAWWLLAPFAESCNYLLHVDTRVRYEGLDLWYRVQRLFPAVERSKAILLLLAVSVALLCSSGLRAAEVRLETVQRARDEVRAVRAEASAAEPYPGGARWTRRLRSALDALKRDGEAKRDSRFDKIIDQFAKRDRQGALTTLDALDDQLGLIEDSLTTDVAGGDGQPLLDPGEIRKLLPERFAEPRKETSKKEKPERKRDEEVEIETKGGRGPGIMVPSGGGGFSAFGWLLLGGLFLACVIVAILLFVQQRQALPQVQKPKQTGASMPSLDSILTELDQHTASALWQQADELARQGQFLEAVRRLYLAVLALLHRSHLIRYEKTRTNGEYVRQVRLAPEAPANVHACFHQLTRRFDVKWYGDRACDEREYDDCRALAEQLRAEVKT